jgi:hypothetical protein
MDLMKLNSATRKFNVPMKMRDRPINEKGYVVPWFVAEIEPRKWDFRAIGPGKVQQAVRDDVCWLCGKRLGVYKTFVIGPMCSVNRVSAEPPSHKSCARYAAQACPFLSQPKMVRNEKDLPVGHLLPPGEMIARNPGVTLLWTTLSFQIERGGLFRIGPPNDVEWWAHGRHATRQEVCDSIESGLPILAATCEGDPACLAELDKAVMQVAPMLPQEAAHA